MTGAKLCSSLCTEASVTSERFVYWIDRLRPAWDPDGDGPEVLLNRKVWEWAFILEALHERGLLVPGAQGIGFGVGKDPLAAVCASFGCQIVATDLDSEAAATKGWVQTNQFAGNLVGLSNDELCNPDEFARNVTYRTIDMNDIPDDLVDYDFSWSSCAFEHLGSLARGQEFILRQMRCLRPGGVAVHTTEYNVFSNDPTIVEGETVLFRRRDIEWLVDELRAEGCDIEVDFNSGASPTDRYVDVPPWSGPHLKLQVGAFVSTSLGLIIERSPDQARSTMRPPRRRALRRRLAGRSQALVQAFDVLYGIRPRLPSSRFEAQVPSELVEVEKGVLRRLPVLSP